MASKSVFLIALCCVLPLIVTSSRPLSEPLVVQGRVYCDTCRAGFLTPASTYIAGAKIRLECKNRETSNLTYTKEGTTDSSGTYTFPVNEDHENQICEVVLVSSPQSNCASIDTSTDRARAILTTNNGIASNIRTVNSLAFVRDSAEDGCTKVLDAYRQY